VHWVVPETPEKHLSSAFAGLMPLAVPPDQLPAALIAAGCRQVILVPDDRTSINHNDLIDQLVGALDAASKNSTGATAAIKSATRP